MCVTILEGGEFIQGFPTECGGINRGNIARVLQAPRDVPEVDPDTRGQINPFLNEGCFVYAEK